MGEIKSMDEVKSVFGVKSEEILKPKEEATKKIMKTEMYKWYISLCIRI